MNQILSVGNEVEKNTIRHCRRKIFSKKRRFLVVLLIVIIVIVIYYAYYINKSIEKQANKEKGVIAEYVEKQANKEGGAIAEYAEEHKKEDDEITIVILNSEKNYFINEEIENEETESEETESEETENEETENDTVAEESNINISSLRLISNVPFYNQNSLGYPMGCEAVSAAMAAQYENYDVSIEEIIENTPTDERGIWKESIITETGEVKETIYGGNPFEVFVGHPTRTGSQGSYGCFANPIIISLTSLGIPCTNISGCTQEELLDYIDKGKPVIVWGTYKTKNIVKGVTWSYPDNSGEFTKLQGEHCMVLVGYDEDNVYLNDPLLSANVAQPRYKFFSNWEILYKQAIIIN